jgi:hypothetical protein
MSFLLIEEAAHNCAAFNCARLFRDIRRVAAALHRKSFMSAMILSIVINTFSLPCRKRKARYNPAAQKRKLASLPSIRAKSA